MTHSEIRDKFLKFFESRGHKVVPSSSLLPENDPTTLFTGSGMQPMMPYLLGMAHPEGKRIVDSQKSFRAEDIEEVGDNRHTTFFEMLGNWSFGDYWKEEQLTWIFQFLTDELGLDPNRLYVTVFAGDEESNIPRDNESPKIWKKLFKNKGIEAKEVDLITLENGSLRGMQNGRIFYYGAEKNWWSRIGKPANMPQGEPGGPDSEIFYEFNVPHDPHYGKECHPNCDCGRYLEIGNSVFMEYQKQADGSFGLLKQRNVDFGGGLERITAAVRNKSDIFETDVFEPLVQLLPEDSIDIRVHRIIADHTRAIAFLVSDGVIPSNRGQGYVLRRLMRRIIVQCHINGIELDAILDIFKAVVQLSSGYYPELNAENISAVFNYENEKFQKTLKGGLRELEKLDSIDSISAFKLYESFGLPYEVIKEVGGDKAKTLSRERFEQEMEKHREISRAGVEKKFGGHGMKEGDLTAADAEEMKKKTRLHTATHILFAALKQVLKQPLPQAGSDITAERLRFDFTFDRKITPEELKQAEDIANDIVKKDLPITWKEMDLQEALDSGASAYFKLKYPPRVKVYTIGDDKNWFSRELCGGPHVSHTGEIGKITITKEESVSGGGRIRAIVE